MTNFVSFDGGVKYINTTTIKGFTKVVTPEGNDGSRIELTDGEYITLAISVHDLAELVGGVIAEKLR